MWWASTLPSDPNIDIAHDVLQEELAMKNNPDVKLYLIAVSRDRHLTALSEKRHAAIATVYQGRLYECPITMCNALDTKDNYNIVTVPKLEKLVGSNGSGRIEAKACRKQITVAYSAIYAVN